MGNLILERRPGQSISISKNDAAVELTVMRIKANSVLAKFAYGGAEVVREINRGSPIRFRGLSDGHAFGKIDLGEIRKNQKCKLCFDFDPSIRIMRTELIVPGPAGLEALRQLNEMVAGHA
jgi:hypothetical protein